MSHIICKYHIINKRRFLAVSNQGLHYVSTSSPGIEFGLQLIDFLIPLLMNYIRYSQGKC